MVHDILVVFGFILWFGCSGTDRQQVGFSYIVVKQKMDTDMGQDNAFFVLFLCRAQRAHAHYKHFAAGMWHAVGHSCLVPSQTARIHPLAALTCSVTLNIMGSDIPFLPSGISYHDCLPPTMLQASPITSLCLCLLCFQQNLPCSPCLQHYLLLGHALLKLLHFRQEGWDRWDLYCLLFYTFFLHTPLTSAFPRLSSSSSYLTWHDISSTQPTPLPYTPPASCLCSIVVSV